MSAVGIIPMNQEAAPAASKMTLLAIAEELVCLLDTAEMVQDGSAEQAELETAIAEFQEALPRKVDRVTAMLAHLEAQAQLAGNEIKRLQDRKKRYERDVERLDSYCVRVLETLPEPKKGPKKLEGHTSTLSIRRSETVQITDESAISADYKTAVIELPARAWERVVAAYPAVLNDLTRQDLKIRAVEVKKALKDGEEIPGADIEYPHHLRRS